MGAEGSGSPVSRSSMRGFEDESRDSDWSVSSSDRREEVELTSWLFLLSVEALTSTPSNSKIWWH